MNSHSIHNEEIKFTLPKIKIYKNENFYRNMNSNINPKLNSNTVQKLYEENKLMKQDLNLDSGHSRFRKIELIKQNQNSAKIRKSFANYDRTKNSKILQEIEDMIESFKNKDYTNSKNSQEFGDSLLNTFKNFVIFKRKKEFSEGVPILKIKQNEFMENLIKSEKVFLNYKF
jgi:hypothetical protein